MAIEVLLVDDDPTAVCLRHETPAAAQGVPFQVTQGTRCRAAAQVLRQPALARVTIMRLTATGWRGDAARCLAAGMDGYLAKPIKADTLAAALAGLLGGRPAVPPASNVPPIDLAPALDDLAGDKALLEDIVALFLADAPVSIDQLRTAIAMGDASQTRETAHSLKSAVAVLGATTAYAIAAKLEAMAQAGDLQGAEAVLHRFNDEIHAIAAFFAEPDWANGL